MEAPPTTARAPAGSLGLDLELEAFHGPFDLLLAVVLREEIELRDVELGEVVVAYVAHLEERGELDLEAATEFLVLIAALLEIKSRLLLPREDDEAEGLEELAPEEAADELLARMLEYRRYRDAGEHLREMFEAGRGYRRREAPPPEWLARTAIAEARQAYEPAELAAAVGELLKAPPALDTSHIRPTVSLERRLSILRGLLAGGGELDFDEHFAHEDRLTQAVTIFALLELYKRGEAAWSQGELFGPITVRAGDG